MPKIFKLDKLSSTNANLTGPILKSSNIFKKEKNFTIKAPLKNLKMLKRNHNLLPNHKSKRKLRKIKKNPLMVKHLQRKRKRIKIKRKILKEPSCQNKILFLKACWEINMKKNKLRKKKMWLWQFKTFTSPKVALSELLVELDPENLHFYTQSWVKLTKPRVL